MAYRDTANVYFRSVDEQSGRFWVICEPQGDHSGALAERFIGLHFRNKVSMAEADRIAALLRDTFSNISITTLEEKDGARPVLSDKRR